MLHLFESSKPLKTPDKLNNSSESSEETSSAEMTSSEPSSWDEEKKTGLKPAVLDTARIELLPR